MPDVDRALRAQALAQAALEDAAREIIASGIPAGIAFRALSAGATVAVVEAQGLTDPAPVRRELEDQLARIRGEAGRAARNVLAMPAGGDGLLPEMAAARDAVTGLGRKGKRRRWWR